MNTNTLVHGEVIRVATTDSKKVILVRTVDNHIVKISTNIDAMDMSDTGHVGVTFDSKGYPVDANYKTTYEAISRNIYNGLEVSYNVISSLSGERGTISKLEFDKYFDNGKVTNLSRNSSGRYTKDSLPLQKETINSILDNEMVTEYVGGTVLTRLVSEHHYPFIQEKALAFANEIQSRSNTIFCISGATATCKTALLKQVLSNLKTSRAVMVTLTSDTNNMESVVPTVFSLIHYGFTTIALDSVDVSMLDNACMNSLLDELKQRGIKLILVVKNIYSVKNLLNKDTDVLNLDTDLFSGIEVGASSLDGFYNYGSVTFSSAKEQSYSYILNAVRAYNYFNDTKIKVEDIKQLVYTACSNIVKAKINSMGIKLKVDLNSEPLSDKALALLKDIGVLKQLDTSLHGLNYYFKLPWLFSAYLQEVLDYVILDSKSKEEVEYELKVECILLVNMTCDSRSEFVGLENGIFKFKLLNNKVISYKINQNEYILDNSSLIVDGENLVSNCIFSRLYSNVIDSKTLVCIDSLINFKPCINLVKIGV